MVLWRSSGGGERLLDESWNTWNAEITQIQERLSGKLQGFGNHGLNHRHKFHMLNHHIHLVYVVFIRFAGPACLCKQKYSLLHWSLPISCILLLKPGICKILDEFSWRGLHMHMKPRAFKKSASVTVIQKRIWRGKCFNICIENKAPPLEQFSQKWEVEIHLSPFWDTRNLHLPFATQFYFLQAMDMRGTEANFCIPVGPFFQRVIPITENFSLVSLFLKACLE